MAKTLSIISACFGLVAFAATPTVSNETAKQRYPWGLVDITCTVSGINGTANNLEFDLEAVMPESGNTNKVSHFWVVQNGTNSTDRSVHTNGNYRLLWDARADLGQVHCNMVLCVTIDHGRVQLWENGPYWATTNIGADEPHEYGYYFWWGDTIGYKQVNNAWVASDGSSSNFSFVPSNTPTYSNGITQLKSEGWITADGVLAPEHDAAHAHWGGSWRMPTNQELGDLNSKCNWNWTTINGVQGWLVSGTGDYASNSIFLPCAGYGYGTSLNVSGSFGIYWSSVPIPDYSYSWFLSFGSSDHVRSRDYRDLGQSVRPVYDTANTCTVTLDTQSGTGGTTNVTATFNAPMPTLTNLPTRAGYTFAGYYSSANGGTQYYKADGTSAKNWDKASATTLYAKWTKAHDKVPLWEGGPYWATTNIGADEPHEYGYYFWWGDTVGYKRMNNAWVASDGLSSNFSFSESNTPTYGKDIATLKSEGWITSDGVLAPEHDAAHAHWGSSWRVPTKQELFALCSKCSWNWTTVNGVQGWLVSGTGDYASNSIFLPLAGDGYGTSLYDARSKGFYLSSVPYSGYGSYSWGLYFDSGYHDTDYGCGRYGGQSVRPVYGTADMYTYTVTLDTQSGTGGTTNVTATFNAPMPSLTDLPVRAGYTFAGYYSLANGGGTQYYKADGTSAKDWDKASATTLYAKWMKAHDKVLLWKGGPYWATANIGADEPWESGYYFWWGDTVGYKRVNNAWVASDGLSSNFSFSDSPTYGKDIATLKSEGWITADEILAPEHDAAHAHWGSSWRVPTKQELFALCSMCSWNWTTMNGVKGWLVSGTGDYASNSIFLPCAGYGHGTSLSYAGSYGCYWSSVPYSDDSRCSWRLDFNSRYHNTSLYDRYGGQSVRPVQGFTE